MTAKIIVGIALALVASGAVAYVHYQSNRSEQLSLSQSLVWQTDPYITLCWDVSADTQMGNACKTGTYPVYDNDINKKIMANDGFLTTPDGTPVGAVEYCEHLESDGITLSDSEVNYWRLPTYAELQAALADTPSGFYKDAVYWSSTQYTGSSEYKNFAYVAGIHNAVPFNNESVPYSVRCVRV